MRRIGAVGAAMSLALLGTVGVTVVSAAPAQGAASPTLLVLSQGDAFSVLGYWCGGIQEHSIATGFDPTTGYPMGDVYLQTTCSAGGRGGHSTTFKAWAGATWDYTGATVSFAALSGPPSADPAFTAFDSFGNEIYTVVTPSTCTGVNPPTCSYRAYLQLAAGFVPPPRLTGLSVTAGPASGGTSVTIGGTGFTGATAVGFGTGAAASFTVNSDTSITAVTAPAANPGTMDVTVTTAGGQSAMNPTYAFTFVGVPSVSGVSPGSGPIGGGTSVTISGVNLGAVTSVQFGDTGAGFTVSNDTTIVATAPPAEAPDSVDIIVSSIGGTSATSGADQFTYVPPVQCAKVSGTMSGTVTISRCTPLSGTNKSASSVGLTGGTLTWSSSHQTTVETLNPLSSPGRGLCALGSTEEDLSGVVSGGTSTYTTVGAPVSASFCVNRLGAVTLVRGTLFTL